jgi:hypothetical protein
VWLILIDTVAGEDGDLTVAGQADVAVLPDEQVVGERAVVDVPGRDPGTVDGRGPAASAGLQPNQDIDAWGQAVAPTLPKPVHRGQGGDDELDGYGVKLSCDARAIDGEAGDECTAGRMPADRTPLGRL